MLSLKVTGESQSLKQDIQFLGYIPGDGSDEEAKEKEPEDKKFGLFTPDSSEEAKEKEPEDKKFGLFTRDADSLSVFPR